MYKSELIVNHNSVNNKLNIFHGPRIHNAIPKIQQLQNQFHLYLKSTWHSSGTQSH